MLLNDSQDRYAGIARVRTQMLVSSERWIGSFDNNGVQHDFKLRHVMSVCSGLDERQRDATAVHQQVAFAESISLPKELISSLASQWDLAVTLGRTTYLHRLEAKTVELEFAQKLLEKSKRVANTP